MEEVEVAMSLPFSLVHKENRKSAELSAPLLLKMNMSITSAEYNTCDKCSSPYDCSKKKVINTITVNQL